VTASEDLRAGRAARVMHHYRRMISGFDDASERNQADELGSLILDLMMYANREGVSFLDCVNAAKVETDTDEAGER
jgi:hypothetical protein